MLIALTDMPRNIFEFQNKFFFHLKLTISLINIHKCNHKGTLKEVLKARDLNRKTS